MYCKKCGAEYQPGMSYCRNCGAQLSSMPEGFYSEPMDENPVHGEKFSYEEKTQGNNRSYQIAPQEFQTRKEYDAGIPEEYRPISMWGYFGYTILFGIPLLGFIFCVVFAFGGTQNINLRNFARSRFCGVIIAITIILLLFLITLIAGSSIRYSRVF